MWKNIEDEHESNTPDSGDSSSDEDDYCCAPKLSQSRMRMASSSIKDLLDTRTVGLDRQKVCDKNGHLTEIPSLSDLMDVDIEIIDLQPENKKSPSPYPLATPIHRSNHPNPYGRRPEPPSKPSKAYNRCKSNNNNNNNNTNDRVFEYTSKQIKTSPFQFDMLPPSRPPTQPLQQQQQQQQQSITNRIRHSPVRNNVHSFLVKHNMTNIVVSGHKLSNNKGMIKTRTRGRSIITSKIAIINDEEEDDDEKGEDNNSIIAHPCSKNRNLLECGRSMSSDRFFEKLDIPKQIKENEKKKNSEWKSCIKLPETDEFTELSDALDNESTFSKACDKYEDLLKSNNMVVVDLAEIFYQKSLLYDCSDKPLQILSDSENRNLKAVIETSKKFFNCFVKSNRYDLSTVLLESNWSPELFLHAIKVYCENEEYELVYNIIESSLEFSHTKDINQELLQKLKLILNNQTIMPEYIKIVEDIFELLQTYDSNYV